MTDEHPVIRTVNAANAAMLAGRWDEMAEHFADAFVVEDRRPGFRATYSKRENLEQVQVIAALGIEAIRAELVEAADRCTAIIRMTFEADSGFEVTALTVSRIDENGRVLRSVVLEEHQLGAAREELDRFCRDPDAG